MAYKIRNQRLVEIVETNLEKKVVIIDEIQKIPKLLDADHLLMEKYRELIFVLTGSSAKRLRKQGINFAGRKGLEFDFTSIYGRGIRKTIFH